MATQGGVRYIDAHCDRKREGGEYYYAQPRRVGDDNTVFHSLFPQSSMPKEASAARPLSSAALDNIPSALQVPSLSASERIKAWEAVTTHPHGAEALLHDSTVHFDASGMDLLSDSDQGEFIRAALFQHTAPAEPRGDDAPTAQPPFHLRVREVEKRFREQMDVHRGLTRAAQQLQLTEKAVRVFRTERRTHALMRAIQERQEAIWRQVWPEGSPPRASVEKATPLSTSHAVTNATRTTDHFFPPHMTTTAAAAPPESAAPAATPTSAVSPTSDLLKDILKAFSKPRELRGDAPSAKHSVSSPLTPGTVATAESSSQRDAPRGGGSRAGVNPAKDTENSLPLAPRVTASGVKFIPPPPIPKPYAVVRYIEVPRSETASSGRYSLDGASPAHGQLQRASPAAHRRDTAAVTSSSSSQRLSQNRFSEMETESLYDSLKDNSNVVDEVGAHTGGDFDKSSSVEDDAYSSDSFVAEDEADKSISSARTTSSSSEVSSLASGKSSSSSFSDEVCVDEVADAVKESTTLTSSVLSTEIDSESDVEYYNSEGRRRGGAKSGKQLSKGATVGDAAVERFMAACEAVSTATKELLRCPLLRENAGKQATPAQSRSLAAQAPQQATASPATSTSLEHNDDADSSSSGTSAAVGAMLERPTPVSTSETTAAVAVKVPSHDWRESLEKQLRNVRHLQRFRTHLLQHLDTVKKCRTAHRKQLELLQQTQAIAKVRQVMLRQPNKKGEAEAQKWMRKMKGMQKSAKAATTPRQSQRRLRGTDAISDEVADEATTETLSDAGRGSSPSIEEDIADEASLSNIDDEAVPDSIEDEVDEDGGYSDAGNDSISESIVSFEEDDTTGADKERARNTWGSNTSNSDEMHSAESVEGDESPRWRLGVLAAARTGLDEIEEELADRLAELSSTVLSQSSGVPSDVEDLVDLLPSSLIPSEVEEEEGGTAGSKPGSSSVHTDSEIATKSSSSAQDRQDRQRRAYIAAKSGARLTWSGGRDHSSKAYIQDSISSSVFTASSDADVDTAVISSETTAMAEVHDASASVGHPSEVALPSSQPPGASTAEARQGVEATDSDDADSFAETESSSTDALTALEHDMALTKPRRQAALRCAAALPSFDELYNPLTSAARCSPTVQETSALTSPTGLLPAANVPQQKLVDVAEERFSPLAVPSEGQPTIPPPAAIKDTTEEKASIDSHPARHPPRFESEAQTDTWTSTGVKTEGAAAISTISAAPHTAGPPPSRRAYAKEDLVAQSSWKARQLHMLRQLRSFSVEEAVQQTMRCDESVNEGQVNQIRPPAPPKMSVELAMHAAENAAREDWAQHWGVLESLLQTRFASPCYDKHVRSSLPFSTNSARVGYRVQRSRVISDTLSSNDASGSGLSASVSSGSVVP
jgi:hypothetical protein